VPWINKKEMSDFPVILSVSHPLKLSSIIKIIINNNLPFADFYEQLCGGLECQLVTVSDEQFSRRTGNYFAPNVWLLL